MPYDTPRFGVDRWSIPPKHTPCENLMIEPPNREFVAQNVTRTRREDSDERSHYGVR